jgi:oxygen-independent coproporphyrinogen-3 oxidase
MLNPPRNLGVYIHLPWCIHKCPYCDFNSHEASLDKVQNLEEDYINAILEEFSYYEKEIPHRHISSIFFGGGTPSLVSPKLIQKIIDRIQSCNQEHMPEITMEANPGTIDVNNFSDYKLAGVNRISLGVQSFNNNHLKKLERIHSSEEAIKAIEVVKRLFTNYNLDLMFALPGQSLENLEKELLQAIEFESNHLSFYHLTIEPQTTFYKNPPKLPSEDLAFEMYEMITSLLQSKKYIHYETSAFAKSNYKSLHNQNYWFFGDYLGLGAGAHSKITFDNETIIRTHNTKNPKNYVDSINKKIFFQNKESISQDNLPFEFMMNALRLNQGFEKALFTQRTGLEFSVIQDKIKLSVNKGLLIDDGNVISPTKKGALFLNDMLQIFI